MSGLETQKNRVLKLEAELRTLAGKHGNRAPAQAPELERQNQALELRLRSLESTLFELLTEQLKPRNADEALQHAECLRLAALEYCRQSKTEEGLWKSIAF